jgi:uncharacterized protein YhfF
MKPQGEAGDEDEMLDPITRQSANGRLLLTLVSALPDAPVGSLVSSRRAGTTLRPNFPVDLPSPLRAFWQDFEAQAGPGVSDRFYEAAYFADSEVSANHLAALVLSGRKRGTATLLWSLEAGGKGSPQVGDLTVVTTWDGRPCCVVETRETAVVPFNEVTAAFAAIEGEGDGSLEYWRRAHWAFYGRECARLGRQPAPGMPVLCEHFEVVFRPKPNTAG